MSAEEAYAEVERRIAEAKNNGANTLNIDAENLERIPEEISDFTKLAKLILDETKISDIEILAGLTNLRGLDLRNTMVSDISHLSNLTKLQSLDLDSTPVDEINALENLVNLKTLYLGHTRIRDLGPLKNLERLETLHLDGILAASSEILACIHRNAKLENLSLSDTNVTDLRPLLKLPNLGKLWFEGTPLASINHSLSEIAKLGKDGNAEECAARMLSYLKSLPPWPDPLPWDESGTNSHSTKPKLTGSKPAPVMVRATDTGQIVADPPETNLENAVRDRAENAWKALLNYLQDLQSLRTKIDNAMPVLGRAFKSFERALGKDFADLNEIDLGMQAERLRALAGDADTYLMDQDPAELAAFIAQLSLYMQRFNAWGDYQEDASEPPESKVAEDSADFQTITDGIAETGQVADDVNAALADATESGTSADATPLQQRGALDSHSNMLDAVSERAISEKSSLGEEFDGLMETTQKEAGQNFRNKVWESKSVSGAVWAVCYLYNNRAVLEKLAARYPSRFKFILDVLRYLFPA